MLRLFWEGLSGCDQILQIKRDCLLSVSDALIDGFAPGAALGHIAGAAERS
jgi:hypothetical protein